MSTGRKRQNSASQNDGPNKRVNSNRQPPVASSSGRPAANQPPSLEMLNRVLTSAISVATALKPSLKKNDPTLERTNKLVAALNKALSFDALKEEVELESHRESFRDQMQQVRELQYQRYSHEERDEILQNIMEELDEWIPDLWYYMQKGNSDDLDVILECLCVCSNVSAEASEIGYHSEFSSHVLITEGSDYRDSKIIFEADKLSLAIKWMWRELLVISASKKLPLRPIMKEINGYHLLNEVLGYLRTPNDPKEDATQGSKLPPKTKKFWDSHWSNAMKDAALSLVPEEGSCSVALM